MRHSKSLLLLGAFTLFFAVAPSISNASTRAGVHGTVSRGPTSPICQAGTPCTAPADGVRLTFVNGSAVHHVRTKAGGRYSIRLAPGRYAVQVDGAPFGYSPQTVTVRAGRMSTLNILVDSGIT